MQRTGDRRHSAPCYPSDLVLGSTFVPNYAPGAVAPTSSENANVELKRLFRVFMADMSDQIVQHLAPITDQVRANQRAVDKVQDSISRLSKQTEESKSACLETLSVLRHWNSTLDSLTSHLKTAEVNQRLSVATPDRLNEGVHPQSVRGSGHNPAAPEDWLSGSANASLPTSSHLQHVESHQSRLPPEAAELSTESNDPIETFFGGDRPGTISDTVSPADRSQDPASSACSAERRRRASVEGVMRDEFMGRATRTPRARRCMKCYYYTVGRLLDWWLSFQEDPPKRKGPFAKLVDSFRFELASASFVVFNIVTLTGIVNYQMQHLGDPRYHYLDWAFLSVYCAELAMRLSVHRWYFFIGPDCGWNNFDATLVALSLYNNITSSFILFDRSASVQPLRILRILRIFRLVRFMNVFSGWDKIIKVLMGSLVHVLGTFLMMAFILYVVGLAMVQALGASTLVRNDPVLRDEVRSIFGSVEDGMFTLFRSVFNGDDWHNYYNIIEKASPLASALFIGFVGFVQLSVANILTATFVLRARSLVKPDHHTQAMEQILKQRTQAEQIRNLFETILDQDGSKTISYDEFQKCLESDHTRAEFMLCGLDIQNAEDFFKLLQRLSHNDDVDIEEFVAACMVMKGGASGIEQTKIRMEARDFQHRVAEHFYRMKHWQVDVMQKLDAMNAGIAAGRLPAP